MRRLFLSIAIISAAMMTVASVVALASGNSEFDKPGYTTLVEDGRLWVFRSDSKELKEFKEQGEPVKQFALIGQGPNGMTVKSADMQTLQDYLSTK